MDEIIKFLKEKVLSKHLFTEELTYELDDSALQGVYSDEIIFSNLVHNDLFFSFDMFVIANEKIYNLNSNGEKLDIRKNYSGVGLFRYELAKRLSSNEITGSMRYVSGTLKNPPAEAIVNSVYNMKLNKDSLSWREEQMLYRDQPNGDGGFDSISFDSKNKIFIDNDKLNFEYNGKCMDISPKTFEKTENKSIFPGFLSREK
ncbi:hypothetical protein LJB96_00870 [Methanobrevibacter sp. OttesenSCG-928-K11]|nr:hypothetical protein [Methanobrevibacter sp. OttesenSCG-928-K11]MDL2271004.1 hypothetical protein [Methanobrevibacter sp. OttesenSCG-928-I08]